VDSELERTLVTVGSYCVCEVRKIVEKVGLVVVKPTPILHKYRFPKVPASESSRDKPNKRLEAPLTPNSGEKFPLGVAVKQSLSDVDKKLSLRQSNLTRVKLPRPHRSTVEHPRLLVCSEFVRRWHKFAKCACVFQSFFFCLSNSENQM
jgi:hypothetical protein